MCNSDLVREHFLNPSNVGDATGAFVGRAGSLTCGASVRISVAVDKAQRIVDAKFKAAGCDFLVAACSLLTEEVKDKTTAEAAAIARSPEAIHRVLGDTSADKGRCVTLACTALLTAITHYSEATRDEWEGDEALICTCFGVSERRIEHEIETGGLRTIAEVTRACNAGAGCRSCYSLIEEILDDLARTSMTTT